MKTSALFLAGCLAAMLSLTGPEKISILVDHSDDRIPLPSNSFFVDHVVSQSVRRLEIQVVHFSGNPITISNVHVLNDGVLQNQFVRIRQREDGIDSIVQEGILERNRVSEKRETYLLKAIQEASSFNPKTLHIFSDLLENSPAMSFYGASDERVTEAYVGALGSLKKLKEVRVYVPRLRNDEAILLNRSIEHLQDQLESQGVALSVIVLSPNDQAYPVR